MNLLREIIERKREEIAARKRRVSAAVLRDRAMKGEPSPSFVAALRSAPMGLIAEIKRKSPSAGLIREPFDPAAIAQAYADAGAQAISVLVDKEYFGGGDEVFLAVREAVSLPLLYKEFVMDPWQVWHAASMGASAALLIVAAMEKLQVEELMRVCVEACIEPLLEVHDEKEMQTAIELGGLCVGINNRDLRTLKVSLDTTEKLASMAPASALLISESGIKSRKDVARLKAAGARAVLVGEHLLKQQDLRKAVRELMEGAWASS